MYELLKNIFFSLTIFDLIDLLIITFIVYRVLQFMRGTRAFYMVMPIFAILLVMVISRNIGLRTTSWVLSNFTGYLLITVVILFQPELRRALLVLGESRLFPERNKHTTSKMLEEVARAATILANRQIGALMVFERTVALSPFVTEGQLIDGELSRDLLISIFIPYSPLHDGAVLISNSRLSYAGSILPLTKREDISKSFGTRHRAAIGITEETDAVVVVVSEERGSISVVAGGVISTELDFDGLRSSLENLLVVDKRKKDSNE